MSQQGRGRPLTSRGPQDVVSGDRLRDGSWHVAGPAADSPAATLGPRLRPRSVGVAVLLMRVGALLSLVSGLIGFMMRDSVRNVAEETLRRDGSWSTHSAVDMAVDLSLALSLVVGVGGAVLWWRLAAATDRGRARGAATMFLVVVALYLGWSFTQPSPGLAARALSVASLAGCVMTAWLLWQPVSTRFFREQAPR